MKNSVNLLVTQTSKMFYFLQRSATWFSVCDKHNIWFVLQYCLESTGVITVWWKHENGIGSIGLLCEQAQYGHSLQFTNISVYAYRPILMSCGIVIPGTYMSTNLIILLFETPIVSTVSAISTPPLKCLTLGASSGGGSSAVCIV